MKISEIEALKSEYQGIPNEILQQMYEDQLSIMETWGITVPNDGDYLTKDCPLSVKVLFFDWLIREAMEYTIH